MKVLDWILVRVVILIVSFNLLFSCNFFGFNLKKKKKKKKGNKLLLYYYYYIAANSHFAQIPTK